MCVIAVCEKRNLTDSEMELCWEANDHGAGVAWIEGGTLRWQKGFMKEEDLKKFYPTIKHLLPHIVHFRIASVGGTCKELTHPFIISPQSPIQQTGELKEEGLLFHNGTYSGWGDVLMALQLHAGKTIKGEVSDSRVIAMLVDRLGEGVLRQVGGRVAIINSNGKISRHGNGWTERRGIWFSNEGWELRTEEEDEREAAMKDGSFYYKGQSYRRIR